MSLTKEMKARRAKEILEDDVFLEVVAKAKSSLIGQWSLTELTDTATRESLYHQDRGLDEVLRHLRILINDFTIEQKRTNKLRK
tara:strand:- start:840 stop:1091 length:252 start_codon:yes stop_codon:yes gene_type:complete